MSKPTSVRLEEEILRREEELREWFTRDCDSIHQVIDGLDIGWGGAEGRAAF